MGRPINKRFFGTPTASGNEIKVNFHDGSAVVEGHIVKQLGSKKFRVRATEDGGSYDRTLVTGKLPAALTGTEMTISVKGCLLYTSPSPRDQRGSRMPSSA